MADPNAAQARKLVKRRPVGASRSPSRERAQAGIGNRYSQQDTPAVPPLGNAATAATADTNQVLESDKEKKSKWRLSNPFHSKEKEKSRRDGNAATDSAYFSSENVDSTRLDNSTSGDTSFSSAERRNSRGDQLRPPANSLLDPSSSISPPSTVSPGETAGRQSFGAREGVASSNAPAAQVSGNEQGTRESYEDRRTGNIVTTVTTTTTTTTTTTGPGGSTTVEQPTRNSTNQVSPQASITSTTGPRPPSPAPPHPPQHPSPEVQPPPRVDASPPIPGRDNRRNRVELSAVSPGVERQNPMPTDQDPVSPVSPARHNFSYPVRAPPAGVPPSSSGQYFPQQQDRSDSIPSSLHPGYGGQQQSGPYGQQYQGQHKGSTMANLKVAAAGLHGAGETLRGTFNSSIDKRFAKPDSQVHAKNQAVIDAGRQEVESGRLAHHQRVQHGQSPYGQSSGPTYNQSSGQPYSQSSGQPFGHSSGPHYDQPTSQSYNQAPGALYGESSSYAHGPASGHPDSGHTYGPAPTEHSSGSSSGGKLGSFMKKMKEGPMASDRNPRKGGGLGAVNE